MQKIILASQSPRRKQLLEWAEVPFEVMVKHSSEDYPNDLTVEEVPEYIAMDKARMVWKSLNNISESQPVFSASLPVVAADTVVIINNEIIGKPATRQDAINSLSKLSGQTHRVITGVAIFYGDTQYSFSETTFVTFHTLSEDQIRFYVDKYQPYDKAGGYAIQEWIGVVGIEKIEGDFYNVMGLPVSKLLHKLQIILQTPKKN